MGNEAVMTSRQAAELDHAMERNGLTAEDVKQMSSGKILSQVREVLKGYAKIELVHRINCNKDPFVPPGFEVKEHIKGGQIGWSPLRTFLFLERKQEEGEEMHGDQIYEEIKKMLRSGLRECAKMLVLNANVLDYLLVNQNLIPEEWKGKDVMFWGTIYEIREELCVRYICFERTKWTWKYRWFKSHTWGKKDPAVMLDMAA